MSSIRSRITYANVASSLALFIAVTTGGAYAANTIGSSDVIDESLLSQDIKNGEVRNSELAPDAVTSSKLANGSIQNSDLGPDAVTTSKIKAGNVTATDLAANAILTGAITDGNVFTGDLANNAVTGAKVAANTLGGADIAENSLSLGAFFSATVGHGNCTADTHVPSTCASATIALERAGRVRVVATSAWHTHLLDDPAGDGSDVDSTTVVSGSCGLHVDGAQIGISQPMGERQQAGVASNHPAEAPGTMALTALSGVIGAGDHTLSVVCSEVDGDLDWQNISLTGALADDDGTAPSAAKAPPAAGARDRPDPGKISPR